MVKTRSWVPSLEPILEEVEEEVEREVEKNNLSAPVGDGTKVSEGPKFTGVTIGTWNIVDRRGNRLEMACKQF